MKSYKSLEKIFKEVERISRVIEILEWECNTLPVKFNAKVKAEQISTLICIKHEILSDALISELLEAVNYDEISELQQKVLSNLQYLHQTAKDVDLKLVKAITLATFKCKEVALVAKEKNDFQELSASFEKLVSLRREQLAVGAEKFSCANYDVILKQYHTSTAYINDICKKIGGEIKGTSFEGYSLAEVSAEEFSKVSNVFLSKLAPKHIQCSLGDNPCAVGRSGDIRIALSPNNQIYDLLYHLGKALYLDNAPEEELYVLDLISMESCGYLLSSLLLSHKEMLPKIKKSFKDEEVCNIFLRSINDFYMNHEFMYNVAIYSIEKPLLNGELKVKDLFEAWTEDMKYYLNYTPEQSSSMLLNNYHWYCNMFASSAYSILGIASSCQLFDEILTYKPKITQKSSCHPLRDVARQLVKIISKNNSIYPIEETLNTKHYFSYV